MTDDAGSGAPATVRRVEAPDGTTIAVHVFGTGPPLLCVPGGPGRASAYLEDLGGLDRSFTVLRADLRGTGYSDLPEDRDTLAYPRLADDLEVIREAFGLDRVAVLAHSAGCHVAMVHALRHPEAVAGLVLVTPSSRGIADTSEDVARIRASRSGEPWYPEVAALLRELDSLPPHRRERLDRGLRPLFYGRWDDRARAHAASTDTQMSLRATAAFVPTDPATAPPAESLRGIDVETCVVVGELDAMTGTQAGHVIADWLPNASVATIPGAGHYPWIDDADRFRDVVSAFLASVAV